MKDFSPQISSAAPPMKNASPSVSSAICDCFFMNDASRDPSFKADAACDGCVLHPPFLAVRTVRASAIFHKKSPLMFLSAGFCFALKADNINIFSDFFLRLL